MFKQNIVNGSQKESPDYWLEYGNPWEFKRHNTRYKVRFDGRIQQEGEKTRWIETEEILGVAYDQIIPGYDTDATNTLRLWNAQASSEINLGKFNQVTTLPRWKIKPPENVSRVLYPDDSHLTPGELRLRQNISSSPRRFRTSSAATISCIKPTPTGRRKPRFISMIHPVLPFLR